jgi:hypothetical protein
MLVELSNRCRDGIFGRFLFFLLLGTHIWGLLLCGVGGELVCLLLTILTHIAMLF